MTNYSKRYKWRSMSSQIIVQLCEDPLTFKNFRSWYFIQTASKIKQNDFSRISHIMWRSKNLGPIDTNRKLLKKKGGMPIGASPSLDAWDFLKYYLGVPWASPSLSFWVSLIPFISRFPKSQKLHPHQTQQELVR